MRSVLGPIFRSSKSTARHRRRRWHTARVHLALEGLVNSPKPTIAMVYGHCVGGGCEIATAMDMRFVAEGATFGIPAARLRVSITRKAVARYIHRSRWEADQPGSMPGILAGSAG